MSSTAMGGRIRALAWALAFVAAPMAGLLGGCANVSWGGADHEVIREFTVPYREGQPLHVRTVNGMVDVRSTGEGATPAVVAVKATVRATTAERAEETVLVSEEQPDGTIQLRVSWPEGERKGSEGVSFEVVLPVATQVTVETSNASVKLTGGKGVAKLKTSNGRIEAVGVAGEVRAETSNASVLVQSPGGAVVADSSNGKVEVLGAPGPVRADTSNAPVRVELLDGAKGPVVVDTSNASVVVVLPASVGGTLVADTSNGRVTVNRAEGAAVRSVTAGKTSAKVEFAEEGPESVVDTSNGSVTIEIR